LIPSAYSLSEKKIPSHPSQNRELGGQMGSEKPRPTIKDFHCRNIPVLWHCIEAELFGKARDKPLLGATACYIRSSPSSHCAVGLLSFQLKVQTVCYFQHEVKQGSHLNLLFLRGSSKLFSSDKHLHQGRFRLGLVGVRSLASKAGLMPLALASLLQNFAYSLGFLEGSELQTTPKVE
jgi:hypothetical protein